MANTYHQIYIQAIFAVKYRNTLLHKDWRESMFSVIGNLINETGCNNIIVSGVEDHVHCFFGLKPSVSLSDVMKAVKSKSSKWLNESNLLENHFEWQTGYGVFSYGQSQVDAMYQYVQNQEEHHKTHTFQEEYIWFLHHFNIHYDENYIFHDMI